MSITDKKDKLPLITEGAKSVWLRNYLYFKKTWLVSVFWIILEPMVYLGAIGFGLGSFVTNIGSMSYVEFFFPGLLCSTAMMVAFFECTYGSYTKLTHQKTFQTILLSRVGPGEVIIGEILWGTTKATIGVLGVCVVSLFFGLIESWRILAVLPVLILLSFLFSCIGMIFTSYAKNFDSFIYSTSGLIVPMSLLSGTYFPIEQLPTTGKYLSYIFPLSHAVTTVRTGIHQGFDGQSAGHIVYLILLSYLVFNIAYKRLNNKLLR